MQNSLVKAMGSRKPSIYQTVVLARLEPKKSNFPFTFLSTHNSKFNLFFILENSLSVPIFPLKYLL